MIHHDDFMSIERRISAAKCRLVNEQLIVDVIVAANAMTLSGRFIYKFRGDGI